MVYVTGDTHGRFDHILRWAKEPEHSNSTVIILGDAGINYDSSVRDFVLKTQLLNLENYGVKLFCIHGNHENRAENIKTYQTKEYFGGKVLYEEEFPNILFAIDGEVYRIDDKTCIVCGGAYSVDKYQRLCLGYKWFNDEQPSDEIKRKVEKALGKLNWKTDIVLTHTCPYKYIPRELFLEGIDQNTVDNSTEKWLQTLEDRLDYKKWYFGHFHGIKSIDKMRMLNNEVIEKIDVL